MDCIACKSSEFASADACIVASEFNELSIGCCNAAVTELLLPVTKFPWYVAVVASSEPPPEANNWAPIGADGPWRPSEEATLTASKFYNYLKILSTTTAFKAMIILITFLFLLSQHNFNINLLFFLFLF